MLRFKMTKILLVLPHSFSKCNNTGLTLQSIFRKYDKTQMAEVVFVDDCSVIPEIRSYAFSKRKSKGHLSNLLYILTTIHDKGFNRFIKEFKPDIVYSICSTIQSAIVSLYLIHKYRLPVIIHHFDNVRETASLHFLHSYLYKKLESKLSVALVISDAMKNAYEKKYHCKYAVLMSAIPDNLLPSPGISGPAHSFVYAGGLHLDRANSLKVIAHSLAGLSSRMETKVDFDVYTPDFDKNSHIFDDSIINIHAGVSHSTILDIYAKKDVLVHVEPFDEERLPFLKYSLTTKLPEYLISGKAILCFAPIESAVLQFIRGNNLGYTATNADELNECLRMLCSGNNKTKEYINNAIRMAKERFTEQSAYETMLAIIDKNIQYSREKQHIL